MSNVISNIQMLPSVSSYFAVHKDSLQSLEGGNRTPGFRSKDAILLQRLFRGLLLVQKPLQ
jgi:hypothetical protein